MTIGSGLTAVHHSPMFSVTVTLCFIKLLHCFPGWPVPLSHKVPSQSDALYMVTLMKSATLRVMYSRRMLENGDGPRDEWLCPSFCLFFLLCTGPGQKCWTYWLPPASLSWGPQSLEPAWGYLAIFSPSAFTMVSFCGFPADWQFQPHSWERQPRKASCWNA